MEDFPLEDQEDQKKKKKRRVQVPSFISTWLKRETETSSETEEEKKPFSERAWAVFQKFFSREAGQPDELEDDAAEEVPQQFLDFAPAETEATLSPVEREEASASETVSRPEEHTTKPSSEDGELIISHEDEEPEEPPVAAEIIPEAELPPLVEPPIFVMQRQAEAADAAYEDLGPDAQTSQPEKIGDLLDRRLKQDERTIEREKQRNRRRNRRLKKQVRELKGDVKDQSIHQETLKNEQQDTKDQVERLRRQEEVSKLMQRQERERAELRASRGMSAPTPEAKPSERPVIKTEADRYIRAEARTPLYETPRQPAIRQETAQPQYEAAASLDMRSERDFERRHEIKDEAGSTSAAGYAALASADAAYQAAAAQMARAAAHQNQPAPQLPVTAPQQPFQASDIVDSPMYRQAVKNGFMTAVVLLAIWLVIYIVS